MDKELLGFDSSGSVPVVGWVLVAISKKEETVERPVWKPAVIRAQGGDELGIREEAWSSILVLALRNHWLIVFTRL